MTDGRADNAAPYYDRPQERPMLHIVPASVSSARRRGRVAVREGTRFAIWARAAVPRAHSPMIGLCNLRTELPKSRNGEDGPS